MAMKPFVKIVKRGQKAAGVERAAEGGAQPQQQRQTPESSARTIKDTVTTWVREFQQRSRPDSRLAFNNLFK
jgi:hypothetical protein